MFPGAMHPTVFEKESLEQSPDSIKITPMNKESIKVACSNCNLRELCMPMGLNAEELDRVEIGRAHV